MGENDENLHPLPPAAQTKDHCTLNLRLLSTPSTRSLSPSPSTGCWLAKLCQGDSGTVKSLFSKGVYNENRCSGGTGMQVMCPRTHSPGEQDDIVYKNGQVSKGRNRTPMLNHDVSSTARWLHGPPAPLHDPGTLDSGLGLKADPDTSQFSKDTNGRVGCPGSGMFRGITEGLDFQTLSARNNVKTRLPSDCQMGGTGHILSWRCAPAAWTQSGPGKEEPSWHGAPGSQSGTQDPWEHSLRHLLKCTLKDPIRTVESQVSGNEPEQETRRGEVLLNHCLPAIHGQCICELTHETYTRTSQSYPSMGAGTQEAPPLAEELLATESCSGWGGHDSLPMPTQAALMGLSR